MIDRFGSIAAFANADLSTLKRALTDMPGLPPALLAARTIAYEAVRERALATRLDCAHPGFLDYLRIRLATRDAEVLLGFFADGDGALLSERTLATSEGHAVAISAAAILRTAIALGASQILLAHNHPSGKAYASRADDHAMAALCARAAAVDINIIDHLIVGGTEVYSMKRRAVL